MLIYMEEEKEEIIEGAKIDLQAIHHVFKCGHCGKKIVVIQVFYGVPHSTIASVLCGDCLLEAGINDEWKENYPDHYKKLMEELSDDPRDEDTEV